MLPLVLLMVLPLAARAIAHKTFTVNVSVDSAIASIPQKIYLVSRIEREFQLHDSLAIDSLHRKGTMHGTVPYEYNVNLMFARRGPGSVPLIVKNGDSLSIHIGDEDDGFRFRLQELEECLRYCDDSERPLLDYDMGQCYVALKQHDKAQQHLQKFLEATQNREYNDNIKHKRQRAEQMLRMMMW